MIRVVMIFLVLLMGFFHSSSAQALRIEYSVSMPEPETHYFQVEIQVSGIEKADFLLQMPAWSPGRYFIFDFAQNVRRFRAESDGAALAVEKMDLQTWKIKTGEVSHLTARYEVFGYNLSGDYSFLDGTQAFISGASILMYAAGYKDVPVSLAISAPEGWDVLSSAGERNQTEFDFPNYDIMIDELVQLGRFSLETFSHDGVEYRVCVVTATEPEAAAVAALVETVYRITAATVQMLGPLDAQRYTYFFHFLPDSPDSAGMEHLHCTQLTRPHRLAVEGVPMHWTYWVAAHEFAHAWNVKRLRPHGLGPFDYTQPVPSPDIWFAEGITNYLADLIVLRSGVWSREDVLGWWAEEVTNFRTNPGIHERSPEQSSFDFWLAPFSTYRNSGFYQNWMSPYVSGELIGLSMDLEIRRLTANQKSFEDFFRLLYDRVYIEAAADSYYLQGRGFTKTDILQALQATTGTDWSAFYNDAVSTAGDMPMETYLETAGLLLTPTPQEPGAKVLATRGAALRAFPENVVIRDGELAAKAAARPFQMPLQYVILENPNASAEARLIREHWLRLYGESTGIDWDAY